LKLFEKFLGSDGGTLSSFVKLQLKQKDSTEGKLCLHYLIPTKRFDLITIVHNGFLGGQYVTDNDSKTPLECAGSLSDPVQQELDLIIPAPQDPGKPTVLNIDFSSSTVLQSDHKAFNGASIEDNAFPIVSDIDFSSSTVLQSDHKAFNGASIEDNAPSGIGKALLLNNYVRGSDYVEANVVQYFPHQYVEMKLSDSLSNMTNCSVAFGIYILSQQNFLKDNVMLSLSHIFSERGDNPELSRYLCMDNKRSFKFAIPNDKSFDFGVQSQYLKKWVHVVAVFDDRNCELFLDGSSSQQFHIEHADYPDNHGTNSLFLGGLPGGNDKNGCDCWMKFIQVYDKKLDPDHVSYLSTRFHSDIAHKLKEMGSNNELSNTVKEIRETEIEERKAHENIKKAVVNYHSGTSTRVDAIQEINATENNASNLMTDLDKENTKRKYRNCEN